MRARLGRSWRTYFSFGFVRNTWARYLSLYLFSRDFSAPDVQDHFAKWSEFDHWVRWLVSGREDVPAHRQMNLSQLDFLSPGSVDGVQFVGRYERLEADFARACDMAGVEMSVPLRHLNQTPRAHYTDYYTDETRRLIADKYREEIQFFNFRFGDGR